MYKSINISKYLRLVLISFVFGLLLYLSLITLDLVNPLDGLWNSTYFMSSSWELSIGRWFWLFLDRFRSGISSNPFNSYLSILLVSIGNILLLDTFDMVNKRGILCSLLIMSSTTISAFLSYRYMSPTFSLSFLLSILSVWAIIKIKNIYLKYFVSISSLCLSLGLYQANISCCCMIMIIYMIILCIEHDDWRKIGSFVLNSTITILAGCIIYKIIWDLGLLYFSLSASDYNGASNAGIHSIILGLPVGIKKCYLYFIKYFFTDSWIKHSILQYKFSYVFVFLFLIIPLNIYSFRATRPLKSFVLYQVLLFVLILLIPVASNASILLSPEADYLIQQTAGMAICIPMILLSLFSIVNLSSSINFVAVFLSAVLLYGNTYAVATDLSAMQEGKSSSEKIMTLAVSELINQNLYSTDNQYYFIGSLDKSPLFEVSELWYRANDYARFGQWLKTSYGIRTSYGSLLRNMGIKCDIGPDDDYYKIIYSEELNSMENFPSSNSVKNIDNYIIIKISDDYYG